jgi:hydrogenase nickel incorporation protein HypA/HybF
VAWRLLLWDDLGVHELGLLRAVVSAVERTAAREGANTVEAVGLRVGTLSGAVPEALLGSWPLAVAGTPLEGSRLELEEVPAAVWCDACGAQRAVDEFYALVCPACGAPCGNLVQGREFEVAYAEIE